MSGIDSSYVGAMTLVLRFARPDDAATIHRFVVELATYEREPDAVVATVEDFRAQLAQSPPPFQALIAEFDGTPAGFALFFSNYSTWRGRPGLYLEDLYVTPALRGKGIGEALLARCAAIAVERGCARFEWAVLDWNRPAIGFYEKLGAKPLSEWTVYRLADDALSALARTDRS